MFTALRPMKVYDQNGNLREVKKGDPVPEAATWKNLEVYVRRRWITNEAGEMWDGRHYVAQRQEKPTKHGKKASAKKAAPAPKPKAEAVPEPVVDSPAKYTEADLKKMSKAELHEIADANGLNPDQLKNDLIADILSNQ